MFQNRDGRKINTLKKLWSYLNLKESKGKRLGKEFIFEGCWHILKEAPEWKGGCSYVWDHSKLKLDDLKYELRPMGAKAAKNEKHVANAQLVI